MSSLYNLLECPTLRSNVLFSSLFSNALTLFEVWLARRSRVLQKSPVAQLLKNSPTFYGTRRFFTVFTTARHWSLSWDRIIRSTPPYSICLRSISILSFHIRLGLPSGLSPSGFPTKKKVYTFIFYPLRAMCHVHLILLDFIILLLFGEVYKSWSSSLSSDLLLFHPSWSKYSPQHPVLKYYPSIFFP
jgi:hypothetical protein